MRFTATTRQNLAKRRQARDLLAKGYEEVGEGGGRLWELYRGYRTNHRIVDAVVAADGKSVFVKIEPRPDATKQPVMEGATTGQSMLSGVFGGLFS